MKDPVDRSDSSDRELPDLVEIIVKRPYIRDFHGIYTATAKGRLNVLVVIVNVLVLRDLLQSALDLNPLGEDIVQRQLVAFRGNAFQYVQIDLVFQFSEIRQILPVSGVALAVLVSPSVLIAAISSGVFSLPKHAIFAVLAIYLFCHYNSPLHKVFVSDSENLRFWIAFCV